VFFRKKADFSSIWLILPVSNGIMEAMEAVSQLVDPPDSL
jgi:hypothetical protein